MRTRIARTTSFPDAIQRLGGAEEELTVADPWSGAVVGGVALDTVAGNEFELGAEFEHENFASAGDLIKMAI